MKEKLRKILEKIAHAGVSFDIFVPEHDAHGHYSTNLALRLAKERKTDPMALAEKLVGELGKAAPRDLFERVEAARPGFVNFWLSKEVLQSELKRIAKAGEKHGKEPLGKGKTVIVEYSQPNIAKELHAGHLRTTFIGDAISNIHEFLGYKVVRWNYLGDWGTQFGRVIAAYKHWGK
ncbi:arginine--tRNA ligase, partial [Candidatus Parcubacteria bacterium]